MTEFEKTVANIEDEYSRLEHSRGWRFLYTPKRTFDQKTKLALIGLNPGGERGNNGPSSKEDGNAYRVERWGRGKHGRNPLQEQICLLYSLIAEQVPGSTADSLMDETFSANFCSFHSKSWRLLHEREKSIESARKLWTGILTFIHPRVLIALGKETARELSGILESQGGLRSEECSISTEWGGIKCRYWIFRLGEREILFVELPHLSRFRVFGRKEHATWHLKLIEAIAARLNE